MGKFSEFLIKEGNSNIEFKSYMYNSKTINPWIKDVKFRTDVDDEQLNLWKGSELIAVAFPNKGFIYINIEYIKNNQKKIKEFGIEDLKGPSRYF